MTERQTLIVFCYDVASDKARSRVAGVLEREGVRVQFSVFELWSTPSRAERLFESLSLMIDPGDTLRFYVVDGNSRKKSKNVGGAPIGIEQEGLIF